MVVIAEWQLGDGILSVDMYRNVPDLFIHAKIRISVRFLGRLKDA